MGCPPLPGKDVPPYIVAQVVGAVAAGGILYLIASGQPGFNVSAGVASNGFGEHSPGGYSFVAALIAEVVLTMLFLVVILGATDKRAPQGFAPIAIGLCLMLIGLISIPITNTSVNQPEARAWPCSPADGRLSSCGSKALEDNAGPCACGCNGDGFGPRG
jgi:aquaporin Z